MKKNIFYFQCVFITILTLFFSSCQVEENLTPTRTTNDSYVVKKISGDEINSNTKITEKLQKINIGKNTTTAKNIPINDLGLIVQTDNATYIENGNYHSFTFSTQQEDNENIKNILFSLNQEGEYDSFLVEYNYSKNDLQTFNNNNKPGTATLTPINLAIKSLTSRSITYYICVYSYILVEKGDLVGFGNAQYEWVMVAENCNVRYTVIDAEDQIYNDYDNRTSTYTTSGVLNPVGGNGSGGGIATSPKPSIYDDEELVKINLIKKQINTTVQQNRFIDSNPPVAFLIYDYLTNNKFSTDSKNFGKWILNYFMQNPNVTIEQFKNWFMSKPEGSDGGDIFNINDYDDIQTIKQDLPARNTFYNAFPKNGAEGMKSNDVYKLVGGHMYQENKALNPNYQNACAIRISRALNYSYKTIPIFKNKQGKQKSEKGEDGLNYILDASSLLAYMLKTFSDNKPLHLKDKTEIEYQKALKGKWGIYIMIPKSDSSFAASGHADFFSQTGCLSGCYFREAAEIYFWELN